MGHAVHLSTLTQKGQVTIPADIRHSLHMHTGDKVAIELVHGKVMLMKTYEPYSIVVVPFPYLLIHAFLC